jgi:predicted AlkP superfamily pyrophosphatase or phosphodiesterase
MKIRNLLVLCLLLVSTNLSAQRVVVIALDGLGTEGFKASKHPNIDKLFSTGLITLSNRPVMPSVTMPNWTSHLTGQGPEEHGVTSNKWTLTNRILPALETDKDGYSPSIFKVLKDKNSKAKTAFYYNWKELIYPFNQKYFDEVSFADEDQYEGYYAKAIEFLKKNQNDPTLVFLYSAHIDHVGHKNKWMSPEYIASIEQADASIGNFIAKLKAQNLFNDTYFLLTSDHGGIEKAHGGLTTNEMEIPWAITGKMIKNLGLTDSFYNSNKNTSLVLAKIFGIKDLPKSWTGVAPKEIFK